jgi:hypothetical protein
MDDLAGIDWNAPAKPQSNNSPALAPFRQNPTPQLSGRSTPLSAQQSGAGALSSGSRAFKPPSKPATPANDSFAGLVSSNSSKPAANKLTLQERQKQLQEEKLRQEAERRKQYDTHFGASGTSFLDNLGSGKSTPDPAPFALPRPPTNGSARQALSSTINKPFANLDTTSKRPTQSPPAEDDLLAAFNSKAPVDASSHFPPPSRDSGRSTPAYAQQSTSSNALADDDDIFGLSQFAQKPPASSAPAAAPTADDDDILGLLAKPVAEFERKPDPPPQISEPEPEPRPERSTGTQSAHDKAVAELVDMGFPVEKSAIALATTESGLDVQAAVSWILNQAHADTKQRTQDRSQERSGRTRDEHEGRSKRGNSRPSARDESRGGSKPAWMRAEEGRSHSGQRRLDAQTQEKDVTQYATELGSTLFKSANSLWKTGQKKIQKTVAELQQEGDPNVPKWLRNAQGPEEQSRAQSGKARAKAPAQDVTDEAMMLEGGGRPSKPSRQPQPRHDPDPLPIRQRQQDEFRDGPREAPRAAPNRMSSQSPSIRQQTPTLDKRPASKLTRQEVEEQSAQAYVSPSRRKKTTPQPDLLASERATPANGTSRQSTPAQSNNPFLQATSMAKAKSPAATPLPPRPKAPPRQIPPASSSALNSSASYRQKGSEAFKRGDYTAAHAAYSAALGPLPQTHPVTIIVLCNRAVTNIKVGDPKAAILDADAALAIIGVSKGENEKIVVGGTESDKDMREFFGKALMRKAEALEHMEKWTDAGKVWREAVEAGVGGSISIQGRNRCEKAAGGGTQSSAPAAVKRPAVRKAPPKPSAMSDLGGAPAPDSDAVKKLKAANAAAEKADDEKFALSDQVDAKLVAWKGTKADNLRALLGSLDKVLWPDAGWKKVGMGDLVMANKVKIIYMKAIAKVHPDKVRCLMISQK